MLGVVVGAGASVGVEVCVVVVVGLSVVAGAIVG